MQQPNKPNKKPVLSEYTKYSSLVFQMIGLILLGVFGGQWLDERFDTDPILTVISIIVCFISALYVFFKTILKK